VDQAPLVRASESGGNLDRQAQEPARFHRLAEEALERLAATILEQQSGPAALAHEVKRSRCPGRVKLIFQPVFVCKAIERQRRRMLRHGKLDQNRDKLAARVAASPAAERALGVLPQNLQVPHPKRVELQGKAQPPNSAPPL
jgi:hypothetical protein